MMMHVVSEALVSHWLESK